MSGLQRLQDFLDVMCKDKYKLIRSFLNFVDNEESEQHQDDRLFKIRKILDLVKGTYISNRELSIDKTMVKFKVILFFKQYLPSKPSSKWSIVIM